MKQIVRCVGGDHFVGYYKSFKVKAIDRVTNPHTGEIKDVSYEGRLCRDCAQKAGYKVKRETQ